MYQGICCSNSFLRVTCFYKTFWCRNTMASVYNVTLCAIFLQTLSSTTHFYASIHFMFTNLCTTCIPASCVLCIHTKGSAPTTFPLVCANLNKLDFFQPYLSLKTQKIPRQSKATKKDKKTAPGLKRAYSNTARIGQEVVLKKIVLKEGICRGDCAFI